VILQCVCSSAVSDQVGVVVRDGKGVEVFNIRCRRVDGRE
jgi:hypothetical protein